MKRSWETEWRWREVLTARWTHRTFMRRCDSLPWTALFLGPSTLRVAQSDPHCFHFIPDKKKSTWLITVLCLIFLECLLKRKKLILRGAKRSLHYQPIKEHLSCHIIFLLLSLSHTQMQALTCTFIYTKYRSKQLHLHTRKNKLKQKVSTHTWPHIHTGPRVRDQTNVREEWGT